MQPCPLADAKRMHSALDYLAEIIISIKLVAALDITSDPAQADMFLVPAWPVTATSFGYLGEACETCRLDWFDRVRVG